MQSGAGSHNIEEKLKPFYKRGTTVPSDAATGYPRGFIFVKTDGTVGTTLYVNEGDDTSADFNIFQPVDADLTAMGALAKTDGNFIVGNGTTWVAESGATARASLGFTDPILDKDAPGTIGADTPAAGTFTTLTATTVVADTISENAPGAGVTVDEALIQNGAIFAKKRTEAAVTNALALTAAETNTACIITSSDVVALPAAAVGLIYDFTVISVATQAPRIDPNGTDTITLDGTELAAGAYIAAGAAGDCIRLVCFAANKWKTMFKTGTWVSE